MLQVLTRSGPLKSERQVHVTSGPRRTEAEHPQPRFGHAGCTQTWQDDVAAIALFSVFKMLSYMKEHPLVLNSV